MNLQGHVRRQANRFNLPLLGRWFIFGSMVGIVAGLGAIAFQYLCQLTVHLFLDLGAGYRPAEPAGEAALLARGGGTLRLWALALCPAVGGLLAGLLVYTMAPTAEGHGTDSAIDAYHRRRGQIPVRVPLVKLIASALTIGSGGSGGREGPIALIGAGFGSFLARLLHLPERDRRILLAAGVGAGVGSIFRAPLAGALFAAEILYSEPEFESDVVIPAALSTIVAYCVFSIPFGFSNLFETPPFTFSSPLELIPYTLLALVVALAAGAFVKIFYGLHDFFQNLRMPPHLKPMLGGLATGLFAVALYLAMGQPQVLDVLAFGYGSLQQALLGQLPVATLLALALGKMLTTSLSIGSGGSGGVFGPSMVIGGSLGGVVGLAAQWVAPDVVTQPGAFVAVGMAGFFAAAANTPISTLVMVSEMTGNYRLLLPALWVCAIAYLVGRRWSLYRSQVPTPFQSPAHRREFYVDVLEDVRVGELLAGERPEVLPETAPLDRIISAFAESSRELYPVVDGKGGLVGLVSLRDVRKILDQRDLGTALIARDIALPPAAQLTPRDLVTTALQRFVAHDVAELPVMDPEHPDRLLGILARRDLVSAYNLKRAERLQQRLVQEP